MKQLLLFPIILFLSVACMKSKEDYRQAIEDVQREEYDEAREAQEEALRRERGSNDAEGMGMDE